MPTIAATKPSLALKRRFNAPPEKVFDAWTDPEQMSRWMGPAAVKEVRAECDVRVGGRYHIKMITADDEHDVSGVYREILANEKSPSRGPGKQRQSASHWSPLPSSAMAPAPS